MRWDGNRESENIEDRRGSGGGGSPIFGGRTIGIGTIVVALVGGWVLGINPLTLLDAPQIRLKPVTRADVLGRKRS